MDPERPLSDADYRRRTLATVAAMGAMLLVGVIAFVVLWAMWKQQQEAACVEARRRNCAPVEAPDLRPAEPIRLPPH